jgi:hypothetical protein
LTVEGADEFPAPLAIWSAGVDVTVPDGPSPLTAVDAGAFEVSGVAGESGDAGDPAPSVIVQAEHGMFAGIVDAGLLAAMPTDGGRMGPRTGLNRGREAMPFVLPEEVVPAVAVFF